MDNYLSMTNLLKFNDQVRKIFFFRICGTGMGATACVLKEKGLDVSGADSMFSPPMSTYLEDLGIPCYSLDKVDSKFLKEFDLIVVGNVVARNSEHAKLIEESGVNYCSFPAALGAFVLKDKNVVGIAGTHGKTTTTYLFTQVFSNLGYRPGHFIGAVLDDRPSAVEGDGNYFFIESDEYDSAFFEKFSKFHSYNIKNLVLTSLEFDHADIFESLDGILNEFRKLLKDITSTVIISDDYENCLLLEKEFDREGKWIKYGRENRNGPFAIESNEQGSSFKLKIDGNEERFETNLFGTHNILNLSSVILFAISEGHSVAQINLAIKNLRLAKRRQEFKGNFKKAIMIDDFAHHPTAVELTINSVKSKYPNKKIFFVFEAVSATARSEIYQKGFTQSLAIADGGVLITKLRPTSVKGKKDLNCSEIQAKLVEKGKMVLLANELGQLKEGLGHLIGNNDGSDKVFLFLGNGTFLNFWEDFKSVS